MPWIWIFLRKFDGRPQSLFKDLDNPPARSSICNLHGNFPSKLSPPIRNSTGVFSSASLFFLVFSLSVVWRFGALKFILVRKVRFLDMNHLCSWCSSFPSVLDKYVLHRFCEIDPLFPGLTQIPSRCWADSCLGIHTVNKEWRWGGTRCREQTNRQTVQCRDTNRRGSHIPMSPQLTKEINTHTTIKCPESCCRYDFFK